MVNRIGSRGYGRSDRGEGICMVKRIGARGYGQADRGERIWSSG